MYLKKMKKKLEFLNWGTETFKARWKQMCYFYFLSDQLQSVFGCTFK